MNSLMDALRKAEEDKKRGAQQAPKDSGIDRPAAAEPHDAGSPEWRLEPVAPDQASTDGPGRGEDPAGSSVPKDTGATLASRSIVRSALQDYFDATSAEQDRSPPAGKPSLVPGDITSPTVQQAAFAGAQTVFAVSGARTSKLALRIAIGAVLVLALALAGAAFYYFQLTPTSYEIPLAALPLSGVAPAPAAPGTLAARDRPAPAAVMTPPEPQRSTPSQAQAPTAVARATMVADGRVADSVTAPGTANAEPPVARKDNGDTAVPETHPEVEVTPGLLRISKQRSVPGLDADLRAGYAAWQQGDLEAAAAAYQRALHTNPDSRDAMLGLAAIALKRDRVEAAYAMYRAVLRRNPGDSIAAAALYAIDGGAAVDESTLKLLREQERDAGPVHFALGGQYAREQRWAEAQQAFFDAVDADGDNADYLYNLAVSLDHLGEYATALNYYQQALAVPDRGAFNPADARSRVAALQGRQQ